jgi:hypothetical protein
MKKIFKPLINLYHKLYEKYLWWRIAKIIKDIKQSPIDEPIEL